MKRAWILTVFVLTGCAHLKGDGEQILTEEFEWLTGQGDPSSEFSRRIQVVGPLDFGQTSAPVAYHNPPQYRAFTVAAQPGDTVDAWVRSPNGNATAWIMDGSFKRLAENDDADATTKDSHVSATVPTGGAAVSWFVVFRDKMSADATFTVTLAPKVIVPPPDFFSCAADADCTAIPLGGCCKNGKMIAVNAQQVDAYNKANACAQPNPICPEILFIDKRVAECNFQSKQCEMVDPTAIHCAGNIEPHHDCPAGFHCKFPGVPDVGGACEKDCDVAALNCTATQHADADACTCIDNPPPKCVQNKMCMRNMRWDPVKCACVPSTIFVPRPTPFNKNVDPKVAPAPDSKPQPLGKPPGRTIPER
ncbi:MAG TPA: hypothetical protein VFF06_35295 [Polyangia bacterium]|nr:hypothetical protein [Polyangia bacterium]